MINLRKLRYFLAVVDNGSLSGAAVALGVSQPTLSQQLAALERHLQQKLLLRTTTGVMVTEAGRAFYRHARSLAARIERAEAEVGSAESTGSGQVSLGLATCGAASTLALPLLRHMQAEYPAVRLRLNDNFAGTLSEFIMTGRIDLAVVYTAPPVLGVNSIELFIEELAVVAPAGVELRTNDGEVVPLLALRELPAVLLSSVHFLRGVIDRACIHAGFEPRVAAEIDSLPALLEAVAAGLGVTLLPRGAASAPAGSRRPPARAGADGGHRLAVHLRPTPRHRVHRARRETRRLVGGRAHGRPGLARGAAVRPLRRRMLKPVRRPRQVLRRVRRRGHGSPSPRLIGGHPRPWKARG